MRLRLRHGAAKTKGPELDQTNIAPHLQGGATHCYRRCGSDGACYRCGDVSNTWPGTRGYSGRTRDPEHRVHLGQGLAQALARDYQLSQFKQSQRPCRGASGPRVGRVGKKKGRQRTGALEIAAWGDMPLDLTRSIKAKHKSGFFSEAANQIFRGREISDRRATEGGSVQPLLTYRLRST